MPSDSHEGGIGGPSLLVLDADDIEVRREASVSYEGGHTMFARPMWGSLLLSTRRFAFTEQRVVKKGRILVKRRTEDVGIRIDLPREKIIATRTETRVLKTGRFSEEKYSVLIVSLDTDEGIEKPVFRVADPKVWEESIRDPRAPVILRSLKTENDLSLEQIDSMNQFAGSTTKLAGMFGGGISYVLFDGLRKGISPMERKLLERIEKNPYNYPYTQFDVEMLCPKCRDRVRGDQDACERCGLKIAIPACSFW